MEKFTKTQTNIAKGIALILLLWHHLFFNSPEVQEKFTSVLSIMQYSLEGFLADFFKVCVAMFLFLSGYGIFMSYEKSLSKRNEINKTNSIKNIGNTLKFDAQYIVGHLIKLLSDYWFIYIIFVPMGLFFGRKFYIIYDGNILKYIADIFGFSYLLYNYDATMNATWWYMSIIIVFYILFPIMYKIEKLSGELLITLAVALAFLSPYETKTSVWVLPFCLGIYFADRKIFERLSSKLHNKPLISFVLCMLLIATFAKLRRNFFDIKIDGFFAMSIVMLSFLIISKIPILNKLLETFGKYSGKIFMFHTFFVVYYFGDYIFALKYSPLILIFTSCLCLAIAFVIEKLQSVLRYNTLIDFLCSKIQFSKSTAKQK